MWDDIEYWVWLQNTFGVASQTACKLVQHFGSPVKLYEAGSQAWLATGLIKPAQCARLLAKSPSQTYEVFLEGMDKQITILTPGSVYYPKLLLELPDYPLVLFARGDPETLRCPVSLAVVGTRAATPGGTSTARAFCAAFAASEAVVVSGGAVGIDAAAHMGALDVNGRTVMVLSCGIDYTYLRVNEELRRRVTQNGVLLSEYRADVAPTRYSFPTRNRIIAGMSQCTVVVEASARSGSLITANCAVRYRRPVFIVPSRTSGSTETGGDAMLSKKGFFPAEEPDDVLRLVRYSLPPVLREAGLTPPGICTAPPTGLKQPAEVSEQIPTPVPVKQIPTPAPVKQIPTPAPVKPSPAPAPAKPSPTPAPAKQKPASAGRTKKAPTPPPARVPRTDGLSENALKVYEALKQEQRATPDKLIQLTALSASAVLVAITQLEMTGLAEREFGHIRIHS